ncbi:MAG: ribose-phosphate diphosphokinase [Nanoarchaeota archaeon]|nr:ribose-phosphate diphosphokinase [Nanoarchaeota archaeon]
MIIIGCSHGKYLAQKIAKKLKVPYSDLKVKKFPDNEIGVRFMNNVRGKVVVLVQSFYGNVNDCVVEVLFAAETAKDLGAKKVILVAPYLPYMRKDKRYESGECISCIAIAGIISKSLDRVYVVDPHLHKDIKLSKLFSIKSVELTSNHYIIDYIKRNIKNPLIVGPDKGSLGMVKIISGKLKCKYMIMEKERISSSKVKVRINKKINLNDKNIVFVDDIISTGNTILESVKVLKKFGVKKFDCIAVHGILVENALEKLRKAKVKVVTTNTIPNNVAKIDISGLIAEALKNN